MALTVQLSEKNTMQAALMSEESLTANMSSTSSGASDHKVLTNRDAADQHPISAITGLENELEGKLSSDELDTAINEALKQAKDSGEFDGADGAQGIQGEKGEKGDKGDQGATGATGASGKDGADGADGVGIKSVAQTTTSTLDGGTNVITVTKTDGSTSTFQVRNGSKGDKGDKGDQGEKGDKGDSGSEIVAGIGTLTTPSDMASYTIYNATVPGITELKNGVSFVIIPDVSSSGGANPQINVNNLGAKVVGVSNGNEISAAHPTSFAGGRPHRVMYMNNYWVIEDRAYVNLSSTTMMDIKGILPVYNGGTGATNAVVARKNLGIYQYSGNISSSSSTAANAMHEQDLSAKTIFGLSSIPSNFQIVAGISLNANMNLTVAHTIGTDAIKVRMRNVSGASVGATTFYYSIIGMLR